MDPTSIPLNSEFSCHERSAYRMSYNRTASSKTAKKERPKPIMQRSSQHRDPNLMERNSSLLITQFLKRM
jgi:hypothetical protein